MAGIIVLVLSFAVAVIGFIQSNRSIAPHNYFGLTRGGAALVGLSFLGLCFAIYDQVQQSRQIDEIARAVGAAADDIENANPGAASALRIVQQSLDQRGESIAGSSFQEAIVSAADFSFARVDGSRFFAADLSGSDFSLARFDGSLFRDARFHSAEFPGASFHGAILVGADFSGVDMSGIEFDESTVFPQTAPTQE